MDFAIAASQFWKHFLAALPTLLLYFVPAWLVCCVLLAAFIRAVKPRLRGHVSDFDKLLTKYARSVRYRLPVLPEMHPASPTAPPTPIEEPTERTKLTWFFRFWTNFGSSPSLAAFSVLIAILAFWPGGAVLPATPERANWWFFPGLCFAGATWLSFATKRVFNRLRPQREFGSFGHNMKDASFPSGHSLTAIGFWGGIVVTLISVGATLPVILGAAVLGFSVTLLTGFSRIYLGVHWPSDVGGGYAMALVWTIVCYFALSGIL